MVTLFFCSKLKYTQDLRVYWLRVKQLIFLTFYSKTNKVKNQIYTKLTVKTAETDSNNVSKTQKIQSKNIINYNILSE